MSFQHVLVPVDGSQISFSAARKATEIAKAFNSKLTLISLVAEDPFTDADFYNSSAIMKEYFIQAYKNAELALKEANEIAIALGAKPTIKVLEGAVSAKGIGEAATELHADIIVMGSHGRKGFQKMILGSFAQDVLSKTELPVLIVKE